MKRIILATLSIALVSGCSSKRESPSVTNIGATGDTGFANPQDSNERLPLSGGTLLVDEAAGEAWVSDPDNDEVVRVDLDQTRVRDEIDLGAGSEPSRLAQDDEGRVHVVLRGTGEVATLSTSGSVLAHRSVCDAPRGLDVDRAHAEVVVACATGELCRMSTAPDGEVSCKFVELDLRDVVVTDARVFVSTFRQAEVLVFDSAGKAVARSRPASSELSEPTVAWRMQHHGDGVVVSHQMASNQVIEVGTVSPPNAYGGGSSNPGTPGIVEGAFSTFDENGTVIETRLLGSNAVLPVDVAFRADLQDVAVAAAGSGLVFDSVGASDFGEPVAVAFVGERIVVQAQRPARLIVYSPQADAPEPIDQIELPAVPSTIGFDIFHRTPDGPAMSIACASCHPEGREDGHIWNFALNNGNGPESRPRRTQSLLGGISKTAPFHWDGDLPTLDALMSEVFSRRMGNRDLSSFEVKQLASFLDSMPELPSNEASSEVDTGRAAFEKAGCDSCHAGDALRSAGGSNVGSGGRFQVPSLRGLRLRAPYMHDGCAATIADRFTPSCGGTNHGNVAALDAVELSALITYLSSL
ncbi:MAG: cytochrome-c peroxidase [Polyangiaceae bacterium]